MERNILGSRRSTILGQRLRMWMGLNQRCSKRKYPDQKKDHLMRAFQQVLPIVRVSSADGILQGISLLYGQWTRNNLSNCPNLAGHSINTHLRSQPRPQGFSLKKWVGREKTLASAGHVDNLNIQEKLIYVHPAGFALTEVERSNNGK